MAPYVSLTSQRGLLVTLPPIQTQRAIASVLGSLDDKIEQNRRTARALERLARAIFRAWFIDFEPVKAKAAGATSFPSMPQAVFDSLPTTFTDSELGPVPEGWGVGALGTILALEYGKALKAEARRPGIVPVYGSNGQVGWHDVALVGQPSIVVGRKGNPGTVHWAPAPFFAIDTTFYAVAKSGQHPLRWLYFALEMADLARLSMDSAVPGLNRDAALSHKLVLPNGHLAPAFCDLVDGYLLLSEALDNESIKLASLRDYLLPQLLSGQVPVEVADA